MRFLLGFKSPENKNRQARCKNKPDDKKVFLYLLFLKFLLLQSLFFFRQQLLFTLFLFELVFHKRTNRGRGMLIVDETVFVRIKDAHIRISFLKIPFFAFQMGKSA